MADNVFLATLLIAMGIVVGMSIGIFLSYRFVTLGSNSMFCEASNSAENNCNVSKVESYRTILEVLLDRENDILLNTTNVSNWTCFDYANYFNRTLIQKYPNFDVRWIRRFDVCNNLSMCDNYHTFLVVGGFESVCMLNPNDLKCVTFDVNNTRLN